MLEYVPIKAETLESVECLSDAEAGRLLKALLRFNETGEDALPNGAEKFLYMELRRNLVKAQEAADRKTATLAANGRLGGRPKKANGFSENQEKANGFSENQMVTKENKIKEKEIKINNTPTAPTGGERMQERFERFWSSYPRKTGKGAAEKAFLKIHPSEELTEAMIQAVGMQKASAQWQRDGGQYIPHPATWLNQKRWEDEPEKPGTAAQSEAAQRYEQRPVEDDDDLAMYMKAV